MKRDALDSYECARFEGRRKKQFKHDDHGGIVKWGQDELKTELKTGQDELKLG